MNGPAIFHNAQIVTADDCFLGFVVVEQGQIIEVGRGRSPERGVDMSGDYLLPGLVEIHTDNLEAHFIPRPKVEWHIGAAVQAYDAQIAAAGITTVFDSLRIGTNEDEARSAAGARTLDLADTLAQARDGGLLRSDHKTHIRCEVPALTAVEDLELFLQRHPVDLVSLMDHTPGQRQFRDLEKYFTYYGGKTGKTEAEVSVQVAHLQSVGHVRSAAHRPRIVAMAQEHGIRIASHDDTTLDEVRQSIEEGVTIAEFPTTLEAAEASRAGNMATVMGAPNVVRGGSHSGNVAASTLAESGMLDILSSDYVPGSLVMAAFQLADVPAVDGLPGAVRLVSRNPARATGLDDRGEIAVGQRADLVRVAVANGYPLVRTVWREGVRIA